MNFQKVFIQRLHPRCHGQFTIKSSCFNDFSFEIGSFIGAGDLVHQIFIISKKSIDWDPFTRRGKYGEKIIEIKSNCDMTHANKICLLH